MMRMLRQWPLLAALIAGALASIPLSTWLVSGLIWLGWRAPIQQWMIGHRLGAWVGEFGLFYSFIPNIVLNLAGGVVCALLASRRWLRLCLAFGIMYFLVGYLLMLLEGNLGSLLTAAWHIPGVVFMTVLSEASMIIVAVAAGWMTARIKRSRAAGPTHACRSCGYDLTGNTSGVCPECGTAVQPAREAPRPL